MAPIREVGLVPLHRGFNGLLVVSAQGRQSGGVDEHFDAAGDARRKLKRAQILRLGETEQLD